MKKIAIKAQIIDDADNRLKVKKISETEKD